MHAVRLGTRARHKARNGGIACLYACRHNSAAATELHQEMRDRHLSAEERSAAQTTHTLVCMGGQR